MTKTFRIKPDLRILLPWLFLALGLGGSALFLKASFLWIPFGISLLILWIFYRRLRAEEYILGDHSIQIETRITNQTITRHDIGSVKDTAVWWLRMFDLGVLELSTSSVTGRLRGLKDPKGLAAIIQIAVDASIERRNRQNFTHKASAELHPAGTLELMNDLVGLWQQGIIDDETFKAEQQRLRKTD